MHTRIFSILIVVTFLMISCSKESEVVDAPAEEEFTIIGTWVPTKVFFNYDNGTTRLFDFEDGCIEELNYCETLEIKEDGISVNTEISNGQIFVADQTYTMNGDSIIFCLVDGSLCFPSVINENKQIVSQSNHPDRDYSSVGTYVKMEE